MKKLKLDKTYCLDFECTSREPATPYMISFARLSELDYKKVVTIIYRDSYEKFMASTIEWIFKRPKGSVFFAHNLKYDISFILAYLFKHHRNEFTIRDQIIQPLTKSFVKLSIVFRGKEIVFRDSMPLFSAPLKKVLEAYTDDLEKGETPLFDYIHQVVIGEYEMKYSKIDVLGLGIALIKRLQYGLGSLTTASDAFKKFKEFVEIGKGSGAFATFYNPLPEDLERNMRGAYRGGFTYLNPKYAEQELHDIEVIDVNSMYPAQMYYKLLPYGEPRIVPNGEVKATTLHPLGIQKFSVDEAFIRDNYVPFLSKHNSFMASSVYESELTLEDSEEDKTFMLTLEEFELFKRSYDYTGMKLLGGYVFKARDDMFRDYIDHFWSLKCDSNETIKAIGKLFLNSLYGKFAEGYEKETINVDYDGRLTFEKGDVEIRECGYLPVGIFITSYARCFLLESIHTIGVDNFIYCDTDSIHHFRCEVDHHLELDPEKLGYWDKENELTRGYYIRAKRYIGEYIKNGETKLKIACAGIKKKDLSEQVTKFEDFKEGKMIKTIEFKQGVNGQHVRDKMIKI